MSDVSTNCLWTIPLDGGKLLFHSNWQLDTFVTLLCNMQGEDVLITSLPLSAEKILAADNEEELLLNAYGIIGSIVVHGKYDFTVDATVRTIIPCNPQLNTVVHVLSLDFFESLDELIADNDPWNTALRLLVGCYFPGRFTDLDCTSDRCVSTKFDEIISVGYDKRFASPVLGYCSYATERV